MAFIFLVISTIQEKIMLQIPGPGPNFECSKADPVRKQEVQIKIYASVGLRLPLASFKERELREGLKQPGPGFLLQVMLCTM